MLSNQKVKKIKFEDALKYLDHKNITNETDIVRLECCCDILQLDSIIRKYKLKLWSDYQPVCGSLLPYGYWTWAGPSSDDGSYVYYVAKSNAYGHMKYLYCMDNVYMFFTVASNKSPKIDFLFDTYRYDVNDIFIDIETTGLNPIVDDILSIGLYQLSTGKTFHKYLPLEKQKNIPKEITDINGITEKDLINSTALTQKDIDEIIKVFQIGENRLTMWVGKNLFDAAFLTCYFREHNLTDYGKFLFQNATEFAKLYLTPYNVRDFSKDHVAKMFLLDLPEHHGALSDCKTEAQICEKIHSETVPVVPNVGFICSELKKSYIVMTKERAFELYETMCLYCKVIYGKVNQDYDDHPRTRGAENIDIHHIDELTLDNIAIRTNRAQKEGDIKELERLKPYNKKERLVYADKEDHFLLHCLIEKIRPGLGGGPHYLYAYIINQNMPYIEMLREIYVNLICFQDLDIESIYPFWETVFQQHNFDFSKLQKEKETIKVLLDESKSQMQANERKIFNDLNCNID